jgi:polysaccharide biosynthesis protein PslH
MMKRSKILYITSRFPFPLDKGDKLRAYHQIKYLSANYDILLLATDEYDISEKQKKALSNYCSEIHFFKISWIEKFWNTFLALIKFQPLQSGYFYSSKANKKIQSIFLENEIKISFFQLLRTAKYQNIATNKSIAVLDYMDALSVGMQRRLTEEKNLFLKPIIQLEAFLLKKYEKSIFENFSKHLIISEQDKKLMSHLSEKEIFVCSNGIDTEYFDSSKMILKKEYDLLFLGNMSYAPNIVAAQYLVNEILPTLPKNTKVLIAGSSPVAAVRKLESQQVKVSGWLEDIREAYSKSKIFVAPMKTGTGLQNKLLEAMSMQLPCVSSTLCNNALNAKNETEILIADQLEDYTQKITHLLQNPNKQIEMGTQGRAFVEKHYSWAKNVGDLEDCFLRS